VGNPVYAGQVRLVPCRGVVAVSVPGRGAGDGDREAVKELQVIAIKDNFPRFG
jgi:hypothetical protein